MSRYTLDASGGAPENARGNARGGDISLTADTLTLAGAHLHADGATGGGRIRAGGGWQGKDTDLPNARKTRVTASTDLTANAGTSGDGGTVVIWSEETTTFAGAIAATGGRSGGDGGRAEVSSHDKLGFTGDADLSAHAGARGKLLLDPKNIVIDDSTPSAYEVIPLTYASPKAGDKHGSKGVVVLENGNLVVASPYDDTAATDSGAARLYRPDGALLATLSGTTASDKVSSKGITAIGNGHYVVASPDWGGKKGAVTWGNGAVDGPRLVGEVSAGNSLLGNTSYTGSSAQGDQVGSKGVTALGNGHYVVASPYWDGRKGAVTWGNGATGGPRLVGEVSATNSLVGSTGYTSFAAPGDQVGFKGVTALGNGHYVLASSYWDGRKGAVTWGNGATGGPRLVGEVSATNSLVGSTSYTSSAAPGDLVGSDGVRALGNGHYVVASSNWGGKKGAVTWGDGRTAADGGTRLTGPVTDTNSLVGSTADDEVGGGGGGGVTVLGNGHYVVASPNWDGRKGTVAWGNGATGGPRLVGEVSATNSLVGSTAEDQVGRGTITVLGNGNYVVAAPYWDGKKGAVTWGNGAADGARLVGPITDTNSQVGATANDKVGSGGITPLANGDDYVVVSPYWDDTANGLTDVGKVEIVRPLPFGTPFTYAINETADRTLGASQLTGLLDAGTDVVLQASNDITVANAITVNNGSGDGGALILQAGRSLLLNADITTDNGDLILIANDTKANGVVDAQRGAGAAVITMAAGTSIAAGTGTVTIELRDGAGKTNTTSGDISLRDITASAISAVNDGPTAGSGVILDGTLAASATTGDGIVLTGDGFTNNTGASALATGAGSRWLVWSGDPANDTPGGLVPGFEQYDATHGTTAVLSATGHGFLHATAGPSTGGTTTTTGAATSAATSTPNRAGIDAFVQSTVDFLSPAGDIAAAIRENLGGEDAVISDGFGTDFASPAGGGRRRR